MIGRGIDWDVSTAEGYQRQTWALVEGWHQKFSDPTLLIQGLLKRAEALAELPVYRKGQIESAPWCLRTDQSFRGNLLDASFPQQGKLYSILEWLVMLKI